MPPPEAPNFEYFTHASERSMIAECGFRTADYLHEQQIGTVVLLDQAARNLYIPIREAWRQQYGDEATPGVYFLNPDAFTSPEIHDTKHYVNRRAKHLAQELRMSDRQYYDLVMSSDALLAELMAVVELDRLDDIRRNVRTEIASSLTPLVADVAQRDPQFNGRVLVLDACWHSGGTVAGVASALRDVGVITVQTGTVNNISNRSNNQPDFVVFGNDEIPDVCKPFGPQTGLQRSNYMVSTLGAAGLSTKARTARKELYTIMSMSGELRQVFVDEQEAKARIEARLDMLGSGIASLLREMLGDGVQIQDVEVAGGLIIPLRAPEDGSADGSYPNINWP